MRIAVDTHVHLYPFYRLHAVFDAAHRNLRQAAPDAERLALCLAERSGQHAYEAMRSGDLLPAMWHIRPAAPSPALEVYTSDGRTLWLIPGRQVVTAERIEVLALGADLAMEDGAPLTDVLARVRTGGALPVLPWGVGKWFGARGRHVRDAIEAARPGELAVADTHIRPQHSPRPTNLRRAAERGLAVLAGSDPLPEPGEEAVAGMYGVLVEGAPERGLPALLGDPQAPHRPIGRLCSWGECLSRLW